MTRQRYPQRDLGEMPQAGHVNWHCWMRLRGEQLRRAREFLGLSQEELARLSGVSQGSVSRMESGTGIATPMLLIMKVSLIVQARLRRWAPLLNEALRRAVEAPTGVPPVEVAHRTAAGDPGIDELLRLYQELPETHRARFLAVMRVLAGALAAEAPDSSKQQSL